MVAGMLQRQLKTAFSLRPRTAQILLCDVSNLFIKIRGTLLSRRLKPSDDDRLCATPHKIKGGAHDAVVSDGFIVEPGFLHKITAIGDEKTDGSIPSPSRGQELARRIVDSLDDKAVIFKTCAKACFVRDVIEIAHTNPCSLWRQQVSNFFPKTTSGET